MLYAYACSSCTTTLEAQRPVADRDNGPECPTCRKPMKRALSRSTVFILRGSGWAKDRYS